MSSTAPDNARAETTAAPALVLLAWRGVGELASLDAACLAVQAYMRFAQLDFAVSAAHDPRASDTGELPVLLDDGEVVAGAPAVLAHLRASGHNADYRLSEAQQADVKAYCSLVEDQLHDALLHAWWADDVNYVKAVQPLYARAIPFPWNYVQPQRIRQQVLARLEQHALGCSPAPDAEHMYMMARQCYASLAAKLDTKHYFFGDSPTTLDAIVFGHLAVQYYFPLPNHKLKTTMSAFPNLIEFLNRVQQTYFQEWTPAPLTAPPSPVKTPRKTPRKGDDAAGSAPSTPGRARPAADASPRKPPQPKERSKLEQDEQRQRIASFAVAAVAVVGYIVYVSMRRTG